MLQRSKEFAGSDVLQIARNMRQLKCVYIYIYYMFYILYLHETPRRTGHEDKSRQPTGSETPTQPEH